jgi:hypothetical protein
MLFRNIYIRPHPQNKYMMDRNPKFEYFAVFRWNNLSKVRSTIIGTC